MVSARTVRMTMGDLLWVRIAHAHNLHFESEFESCHGVIEVDVDHFGAHFDDRHLPQSLFGSEGGHGARS